MYAVDKELQVAVKRIKLARRIIGMSIRLGKAGRHNHAHNVLSERCRSKAINAVRRLRYV